MTGQLYGGSSIWLKLGEQHKQRAQHELHGRTTASTKISPFMTCFAHLSNEFTTWEDNWISVTGAWGHLIPVRDTHVTS